MKRLVVILLVVLILAVAFGTSTIRAEKTHKFVVWGHIPTPERTQLTGWSIVFVTTDWEYARAIYDRACQNTRYDNVLVGEFLTPDEKINQQ
jgi:hypothetical protein